ncbi:MAG: class I SAM-dependent methyltransferase [Hyphomonadaceae bacterium]
MDDANYADRVNGQMYTRFIKNFHEVMKPETYLEIGTQSGGTLMLAGCASIAIDPKFQINVNVAKGKPTCFLYQKTSDDFFHHYNPTTILGAAIDFVFLDGLHRFEFLLRDFMNAERFAHERSFIMMHDCVPPGFYMTTRDMDDPLRLQKSRFGPWWTGDVFKVIPVLRHYRPDLKINVLDCAPTGLVMITGQPSRRRSSSCSRRYYSLGLVRPRPRRVRPYWSDLRVQDSQAL